MLQLSSFDNCEPDEDSCRIVVEGNNYPIVGICTRYCYSTSSTIYCVNQNVKQTTPASLEKVGSKNKLAMNTNESCPRATYSLALLASLTYMSVNSIVFWEKQTNKSLLFSVINISKQSYSSLIKSVCLATCSPITCKYSAVCCSLIIFSLNHMIIGSGERCVCIIFF